MKDVPTTGMCACARALLVLALLAPAAGSLGLEQTDVDPRLAQPVTITCVNVRLHTALERISKQTGVAIGCGRDSKDWRVRDIPVAVCARQLPLGKLLQAISESTRLLLSRNKGEDGRFTYRIWRDRKREGDLATYAEREDAAKRVGAAYDWDVWSGLKDLAPVEPKTDTDEAPRISAQAAAISRVLADLGPEAKEMVLSGKEIRVGMSNVPPAARKSLGAFFENCWKLLDTVRSKKKHPPMLQNCRVCHSLYGPNAAPPPKSDEEFRSAILEKSDISIRYDACAEFGQAGLRVAFRPGFGAETGSDFDLSDARRSMDDSQHTLPPPPKIADPPKPADLSTLYTSFDPVHYFETSPLLLQKITLEVPKEKKRLTYTDVLEAVCDTAGISIVCEDFPGRVFWPFPVLPSSQEPKDFFGRKMKLVMFLKPAEYMAWSLDEKDKLVIGTDRQWPHRLANLVAGSVIEGLIAKLGGPGLQLDDLEPLVTLTAGQSSEWLATLEDARNLTASASELTQGQSLWPLYFALTPADRTKARSDTGVTPARYGYTDMMEALGYDRKCSRLPSPEQQAFLQPEILAAAVIRVISEDAGEGKTNYSIKVQSVRDGQAIERVERLGPFPIYAPSREAELRSKKAEKKAG